ncbi:MAG: LysR substrate-binding domain-containing protein, partial [Rubrivivax sp.]
RGTAALADEPLLGAPKLWERWFALDGCAVPVNPVASFNDAGLMLLAAEQGIGITLGRELLAADALRDGRLVRLSPLALPDERTDAYWLAYAPEIGDWPPLHALRNWLHEELARSLQALGERIEGIEAPGATA